MAIPITLPNTSMGWHASCFNFIQDLMSTSFWFLNLERQIGQGHLLLILPYIAAYSSSLEEIRDEFVMFQGGDWSPPPPPF